MEYSPPEVENELHGQDVIRLFESSYIMILTTQHKETMYYSPTKVGSELDAWGEGNPFGYFMAKKCVYYSPAKIASGLHKQGRKKLHNYRLQKHKATWNTHILKLRVNCIGRVQETNLFGYFMHTKQLCTSLLTR